MYLRLHPESQKVHGLHPEIRSSTHRPSLLVLACQSSFAWTDKKLAWDLKHQPIPGRVILLVSIWLAAVTLPCGARIRDLYEDRWAAKGRRSGVARMEAPQFSEELNLKHASPHWSVLTPHPRHCHRHCHRHRHYSTSSLTHMLTISYLNELNENSHSVYNVKESTLSVEFGGTVPTLRYSIKQGTKSCAHNVLFPLLDYLIGFTLKR